jgi:amino acid transporter
VGEYAVAESFGYRLKSRLLGSPLDTAALEHERLGNPTALAIFASDCISSSAYASEEILRVLVPVVGIAAFSLLVPITISMLVVLFFLTLSYRETIKEYPSAGGAYIVTLDNFGIIPAQVAGVALLTDYILTVAVSTAAGVAAIASAFPEVGSFVLPLALLSVVIIAYGNLRGLRESGSMFRVPTYFFIAMMGVMFAIGFIRMAIGDLPKASIHTHGLLSFGAHGYGTSGTSTGIFLGAALFVILRAFSSGATAVTGVEAISNGVPAFRKPEWRNARKTLTYMSMTLGVLFLGLSILASHMHVAPYENGYPTVIAEVARLIFGKTVGGRVGFYAFQIGTMLILLMAANTSFADFPRLASFHAGDNFMPRQLTKRGHRLQFSNGIILLAVTAGLLLVVTDAKVDHLIPLYAIGVFLSFTLSQAGMARHHLRKKEPHWRRGIFVNGTGALLSFVVLVVFAITKFTHGAWFIIILVPCMVTLLVRLNRQYESEQVELKEDAMAAATAPIMRRHVALVFINDLDSSAARAILYARTLMPDELRAVHIAVDGERAGQLGEQWAGLAISRIPLELVECPDRRVTKAAVDLVAAELNGETEVSVLLPRRVYRRWWHKLLHDSTGEQIALAVGRLPHANVTTVPFQFERVPTKVHHDPSAHTH